MGEGNADFGEFYFPSNLEPGSAMFSLRPEAIALASSAPSFGDPVRFIAAIRQQIYAGATELLELETDSGRILRARIPSSTPRSGTHQFVFSAASVVPVRE